MAGRVRQPIDVRALERWIAANVPNIEVPLDVKQFGFGQSNPTYQLTAADGQKYVLRKKPPGRLVSKTAHKVEREYRIIHALSKTDVPVPKAYCLCEDESVIGTPFYIMEFLDGRIFEDPVIPNVLPDHRRAIWYDAVRTLAKLHRIDPKSIGLENFGKAGGFYNRQIATWKTICKAQAAVRDVETREEVGQLPHFDELMTFFSDESQQPADRATLIHGDFKIDNLVFHKTEPRVIGILDWEMSTIGHPLSDISNLMTPYFTARLDPRRAVAVHPGFLPRATHGLPTPEEITNLYFSVVNSATTTTTTTITTTTITLQSPSNKPTPTISTPSTPSSSSDSDSTSSSSSPPSSNSNPTTPATTTTTSLELTLHTKESTPETRRRELQWAQAFNIFRLAAICQGIAARYASRQASSEHARRHAEGRNPLAEFAWELVLNVKNGGAGVGSVFGGGGSGSGGSVGGSGAGAGAGGDDSDSDGEEAGSKKKKRLSSGPSRGVGAPKL